MPSLQFIYTYYTSIMSHVCIYETGSIIKTKLNRNIKTPNLLIIRGIGFHFDAVIKRILFASKCEVFDLRLIVLNQTDSSGN